MLKPLALVAALFLGWQGSAHADYVVSSQGVDFSFHQIDADSFTLRIQHALDATGDWASADHLGFLAFKGLGPLTGLSGITVSSNAADTTWSYRITELNGQGCSANAKSGGLCLSSAPNVALSNDLMLTFNLEGTQIALDGPLHLKVGFTQGLSDNIIGSLLSADMLATSACTANCVTTPNDTPGQQLPEPGSMALAGLALAGLLAGRKLGRLPAAAA